MDINWRQVWASVVLSISLGVYARTLSPSVAGGDAGELAVVSHGLGVAHPPGYPTLTMLTHASEVVGRWASPGVPLGVLQNSFHAAMSAVANMLLYYTTAYLTDSIPSGIIAALLFGFAPIVWTYSTHAEVFSLNNLLVTLLELLCVLYHKHRSLGTVYLGAFVTGLSLTNQHTSVLYAAPFVAWVGLSDLRRILVPRRLLALIALFLLGLSPYLYLPYSALYIVNPNSWGACGTWEGFLTHFFRKEYGTFSLASQEANYMSQSFRRAWEYYAWDTTNQTLQVLWVFGVFALAVALAKVRHLSVPVDTMFAATLLIYLNFFHYLCNLPIDRPLFYGVQQRFWIQPLSLLAVFIGKGIADTVRAVVPARVSTAVLYAAAACVGVLQVWLHFEEMDQSSNYIVHDFGKAILTPLPKNAILLTKGDIMINSARYVQELHGVRPDVRIVDQEMMTYNWYVASVRKAYEDLVFPGDYYYPNREGCFDISMFYAANRKRRIFLAHGFKEGDHSWEGKYTTMPYGLIHEMVTTKAKAARTMKKLKKYLKETTDAVPPPGEFMLPPAGKYAEHTWEQVVRSDYWMGLHNQGYALLDWYSLEAAKDPHNTDKNTQAYLAATEARKIFSTLVAHNEPPRGIAHRNLGVTLQALQKYDPSDMSIVRDMRDAFRGYLTEGAAPEEQMAQIRTAVDYYDKVLDT